MEAHDALICCVCHPPVDSTLLILYGTVSQIVGRGWDPCLGPRPILWSTYFKSLNKVLQRDTLCACISAIFTSLGPWKKFNFSYGSFLDI